MQYNELCEKSINIRILALSRSVLKHRMLQRLIGSDALSWIPAKHSGAEIVKMSAFGVAPSVRKVRLQIAALHRRHFGILHFEIAFIRKVSGPRRIVNVLQHLSGRRTRTKHHLID